MGVLNKTPDMSFVIERRPDREDDDCKRDRLPDAVSFKRIYCEGQIGMRSWPLKIKSEWILRLWLISLDFRLKSRVIFSSILSSIGPKIYA